MAIKYRFPEAQFLCLSMSQRSSCCASQPRTPHRSKLQCAAHRCKSGAVSNTVVAATVLGTTLAGIEAWLPHSVHAAENIDALTKSIPAPITDLANEAPFWENMLRYVQYFFSIMLGTVYVMLKPFASLLRNPLTGILVIGGTIGLVYGVKVTVQAMLGVEDFFDYQASSIVTPVR